MNLTFFGCFVRGLLPPTFCFLNGAALRLANTKEKRSHSNFDKIQTRNRTVAKASTRETTPPEGKTARRGGDESPQVFPDRGQRGDTSGSCRIDTRGPGEDVRVSRQTSGRRNGVTLPGRVLEGEGAGGGVGRRPPLHMRIAVSHRFRPSCQWPWIIGAEIESAARVGKNRGSIGMWKIFARAWKTGVFLHKFYSFRILDFF